MISFPDNIVGERTAKWAFGILFFAVVLSMAQLTWFFVPKGDGFVGHVPAGRIETGGGAPRARNGLASVAGLNLFGEARQEVAQQRPIDAPATRLNLTLRGVVAAGNRPEARAIISAPGHDEEHYRVGDSLPGGAVLEQVLPDRVILRRAGQLEALHLPKEAPVGQISQAQGAPDDGSTDANLPPSAIRKLQDYRQKIVRQPQEAFKLARVQPVMEAGRLKGYRLSPNVERRLFDQLGLRSGDIVTSVNGIPLDNPAMMGQVFSQLSQAAQLNLTIERNGAPTSVTIPFGR